MMATKSSAKFMNSTPGTSAAVLGMAMLSIRLVQGFILWGGASRRLFYSWGALNGHLVPIKLDPASSGYLASKLLHAAPGSLIGPIIHGLVAYPDLLHGLVWFWTIAELVIGIGLIIGLFTRLFGLGSLLINIPLMVIFGWMGSTCVDEWTMAAAGFAMGATLMISGGGPWSLDQLFDRRYPGVFRIPGVALIGSGDIPAFRTRRGLRWIGILGLVSLAFTVGFYAYYRGAVVTPLGQRVNFDKHGMQLSKLDIASNGSVTFKLYENQGPDVGAQYIVSAKLVETSDGSVVEKWNHEKLSNLPQGDITNQFRQPWAAQARTAPYGLSIITGAKARLTLPASSPDMSLPAGHYKLVLESVDGKEFSIDDRLVGATTNRRFP